MGNEPWCVWVVPSDCSVRASRTALTPHVAGAVASKSLVKTFRFVADMERKVSAQAARAAKQGNVDRALKLAESKSGAGMQDILRKQRFAKLRRQRERLTSGHRQLVAETRFTMHELRRIQQEFMRRANGGATLHMAGFVSIMTAEWPSLKPEALESMFHAFDTDNSMDIDYVELVLGLSKVGSQLLPIVSTLRG